MDQRTSDVEEDLKDILRTRLALAEKIELLEQRVQETIHGTKSVALDAIDQVRNSAVHLVESTTQALDPTLHARRRPWLFVGGAIAVGFVAGLLDRRRKAAGVYAYYPPRADGADVMPSHGAGETGKGVYPFYSRQSDEQRDPGPRSPSMQAIGAGVKQEVSSLWKDLAEELEKERDRIHAAALEAGKSFVRDAGRILIQLLVDSLTRHEPPSARGGAAATGPSERSPAAISRVA